MPISHTRNAALRGQPPWLRAYEKLKYSALRDFTPVSRISEIQFILAGSQHQMKHARVARQSYTVSE